MFETNTVRVGFFLLGLLWALALCSEKALTLLFPSRMLSVMGTFSRVQKTGLLVLIVFFTFALLTIESRLTGEEDFRSQAPTFMENGHDLAVPVVEPSVPEPLHKTVRSAAGHCSPAANRFVIPFHLDRAPPAI